MRIMFLNLASDADWGGGERWMLNTAKGLSERGHAVTLIGRKDSAIAERSCELGLKAASVTVGIDYSLSTIFSIMRLLRYNKTEVIVVHHNKDVRTGGVAAKLTGVPVVHRNGFPILLDTIRHRITYMFIDRILTNANSIRDKYISYGWIKQDEIDVVPNGISFPAQLTDIPIIREEWGVNSSDLIAVFAGRLTKVKRVADLLDAFSLLDNHSRWRLVVLGRGGEEDYLRNRAEQEDIRKRVRIVGFRENAERLLKAADIVLLPSSEEGMPNVLMEAMARGVPVAATPVGDVPFLLHEGKAGWLVETGDIGAWAELLTNLENQPETLAAMGEAGRKRIAENFTFDKMLNGVVGSLSKTLKISFAPKTEVK